MTSTKKPETVECPACGTAMSDRQLLMVPDAVRLLRAYGHLDDNTRKSVVDLVENIAADCQRPAGHWPLRNS